MKKKERSLGRLIRRERVKKRQMLEKHKRKTSQNVADGSMLQLMGIPIAPLTQGERYEYIEVKTYTYTSTYVYVAPDCV